MAELKEQYKDNLDEKKIEKIKYYSDKYFEALANAYNTYNKIEASYPSWALVGRAGFDTNKQDKQTEQLFNFYQKSGELFTPTKNHYYYKIKGICQNTAIYSDDDDAMEKLENKIREMEIFIQKIKKIKVFYKKNKTVEGCEELDGSNVLKSLYTQRGGEKFLQLLSVSLQDNSAEIRRLKNRLEDLQKLKQRAEKNKKEEYPEVDGVTVEENAADMRIRLFFNGKPSEAVRNVLKANGFRWSGKNGAWQRQLTNNGVYATKEVLQELKGLL